MSPEKPWGMTIMFTLSTWFVLICSYKTALKMQCSKCQAYIAAALCLFFLFNSSGGASGRTEEFMKPAYALLVYGFICYAVDWYAENREGALRKLGWIVGCGFAWNLLIKYNNAVPFAVVGAMVMTAELFWQRSLGSAARFMLRCILGCVLVALPIVGYLYCVGALSACWHVYVEVNIETYEKMKVFEENPLGAVQAVKFISKMRMFACLPLIAIFFVTMGKRYFPGNKTDGHLRLILIAMVGISYAVNIAGPYSYYVAACSPMCIAVIVPFVRILHSDFSLRACLSSTVLFIFAAISLNGTWNAYCPLRVRQKLPDELRKAQDLVSTVPHARIMYRDLDLGIGNKASALPACRYWFKLNGASQEVLDNQEAAIRAGKADFCVVTDRESEGFLDLLQENGYRLVCRFSPDGEESSNARLFCIYQKEGL